MTVVGLIAADDEKYRKCELQYIAVNLIHIASGSLLRERNEGRNCHCQSNVRI